MVAATLKPYSAYIQSWGAKSVVMKFATNLLLAVALTTMTSAAPAEARRGEQSEARLDMQSGQVKSLREIEASVVPRMRGMQYLGPEYDPGAQIYRLKFINKDRVIFVDVDGRTGAVLSQR